MPENPDWWLIAVLMAIGFALLAKGADWFVGGASLVARRLGVSGLVIGLTVVACGTSAPEVVVSGLAAYEGKVSLSLGNVLGSNIANVGLVLGTSALVLPAVLQTKLTYREIFWLGGSLAILWWCASDGEIVREEGAFLIFTFVVYNAHVLLTSRKGVQELEYEPEFQKPWLWLGIGLFAILIGAKLAVMGAESAALRLGVPQSVVGLTVVAIGTSLPELAAGLGAALKGQTEISIGNVIGSNVFNILAVLGIVALVQPLDPNHPGIEDPGAVREAFRLALKEDLFIVAGFSAAALVLPKIGGEGYGRLRGGVLLLAYVAYTYWLYVSRAGTVI